MKERTLRVLAVAVVTALASFGFWGAVAHGQAGAAADNAAPTDKAAYFGHGDIESIWKNLEAKQVINKRVLEGGKYSINIRIIKETSAPLIHGTSADVWVMEEGSAIAVTGGTLLNQKKTNPAVDDVSGSSIEGGHEQPFMPGDILYVPPGVPHGFKNIKGFRAYLIRFDVK
jgi:mannose-6-phosphate isomerase-like protein (cupin superfamily)